MSEFTKRVHLPLRRREKPFLAFHVVKWGYSFGTRWESVIWRVGVIWGIYFTERSGCKWGEMRLPVRRRRRVA